MLVGSARPDWHWKSPQHLCRIPRWGMGFRTRGGHRSRGMPDAVAAALGITQQPGTRVFGSRWRRRWRAGCGCFFSTTANMSSTASQTSSRNPRYNRQSVQNITTSREGLGVDDERSWRVASLEVVRPWRCSLIAPDQTLLGMVRPRWKRSVVVWTEFHWQSSWPRPDGVDDRD